MRKSDLMDFLAFVFVCAGGYILMAFLAAMTE